MAVDLGTLCRGEHSGGHAGRKYLPAPPLQGRAVNPAYWRSAGLCPQAYRKHETTRRCCQKWCEWEVLRNNPKALADGLRDRGDPDELEGYINAMFASANSRGDTIGEVRAADVPSSSRSPIAANCRTRSARMRRFIAASRGCDAVLDSSRIASKPEKPNGIGVPGVPDDPLDGPGAEKIPPYGSRRTL